MIDGWNYISSVSPGGHLMKATTGDRLLVLSSVITLAVTIIWNLKSNLKKSFHYGLTSVVES